MNYPYISLAILSLLITACERKARDVDLTSPCKPGEAKLKSGECGKPESADGKGRGGDDRFGNSGVNRDETDRSKDIPKDEITPKPDGGPKPDNGGTPKPDNGGIPKPDDGGTPKPDNGVNPKPDNTPIPDSNDKKAIELDEISKKANLEVVMSEIGVVKLIFKSKNSDKFKDMKFSVKSAKELAPVTEKIAVKGAETIIGTLEAVITFDFKFEDQLCTAESQLKVDESKPVILTCKK